VADVLERTRQAIIDAGRDHGVAVDTVFLLYRPPKGEFVGRVRITDVWRRESGGRIIENRGPVLVGDRAVATVVVRAGGGEGKKPPPEARRPRRPGVVYTSLVGVRADSRTVVLRAGEAEGVKVGKVFYVYDDDKYVGRVRVALVKPGMSGARIIESRDDFKPGFRAVHDPEDERRDNWIKTRPRADTDAVIRKLRAKIADPKTKEEDRAAARAVLRRLLEERRQGK
jgi:hypothetical protein